MNDRRRAIRVVLWMGLVGLTLAAAGAAAPAGSAADVARCAAITAPDERLACYDALVCAGIAAADERLACYDALAKPRPSQPQAAPADAARPEGGGNDVKNFGVIKRRLAPKPEGPELIKALVAQVSVDRLGNVSVSLDNGQSWSFHDPDALLRSGDAVTIRRAALGSFLMTTPRRHTYRVQRMK
jgi:hypothetical protein